MNLHWVDWAIVAAVLSVMVVGVLLSRGYMRGVADFLAANRTAGRYILSLSQGMAGLGAVGAIPVHLGAGIWGTLAVGLYGDLDLLGTGLTRAGQIFVQTKGIIFCGIWTFGMTFVLMWLVNRVFRLRVSLEDEIRGLNLSEHGIQVAEESEQPNEVISVNSENLVLPKAGEQA